MATWFNFNSKKRKDQTKVQIEDVWLICDWRDINREWGWKWSRTRGCHLLLLYPLPLFNHTESWAPQVKKELVSPSLLIPYTIWFSKFFPAFIDPEKTYTLDCCIWCHVEHEIQILRWKLSWLSIFHIWLTSH